jgi:phage terminase large subunit-like protein
VSIAALPGVDHFAEFVRVLTLDGGEPMRLEPFQRTFLADYFAGTAETVVLLPKKNGKTTIVAAVAVHHLLYVPDAEVYVAAASRDQAGLVYKAARRFVERSPALQQRVLVRAGTRELRSRRDDGFLRVLASDADTADGVGPTLAIVDELHRHRSTHLYDVFSDGLDARDGRMLTISTAGSDEDSPLGRMRSRAYEQGRVRKRGAYRYARTPGGEFALHEWALEPTDDLDDLKLVKRANPLAAQTVDKLRRRKDSPSMTRSRWARFACGVWAQDDDAAVSALDWAPCAEDYRPLAPGTADVVIGVDLGWKRDTTALVPVGILDDEDRTVDSTEFYPDQDDDDGLELPDLLPVATFGRPTVIAPPGDGRMTPEATVHDALRELAELYPRARYAIDPNADGQSVAQWIERELCDGDEARVLVHSQQPAPMMLASMGLAAQIRGRAIRHPNDPALSAAILAAVPKYVGERWRLVSPNAAQRGGARKPIDAAIAAAMALRVLRAPVPTTPQPFVIVARND